MPERTPLRVKLISAVLGLVAVALVVISFASVSVIKSYLLGNVDQQLGQLYTESRASQTLGQATEGPIAPPEQFVVEGIIDGRAQALVGGRFYGAAGPRVPNTDAWLAAHAQTPTTVGSISGDTLWRVVAYPGHDFGQRSIGVNGFPVTRGVPGTLVIGIDVTSTYHTVSRLAFFDFIISLILLVAIALAGIAVVRASLRPLLEIEKTAGAIAAGDITRRVPERNSGTEVGRLGRSLNVMLSQIEAAFRARAESERAARRSEERMRQFVADASHELRTPLTAIRGFAEYYRQRGGIGGPQQPHGNGAGPGALSGTSGSGQQAGPAGRPPAELAPGAGAAAGSEALASTDMDRIMRRVEQESARMGVLVEDMLLLARLDQQRPLDLRTVDLLTMAADAVHDARVVAPDRSINLEVGSRAALLVTGDEVRLRQVISNLMSNALVHTPPGTPIEVRLRTGSLAEAQAAAASRAGGEAQAATAIDWSAAGEAASRPAASGALAPDGTIMGNEHSAAEGAAAAGPAAGESQQAWTATPMRDTTKRGEASVARATSAAHGATAAGGTGPALGRADGGWPDPAMTPAAPEAGAARSPSGVGRAGTAWPAAVLEVADLGSGLSPEQSEHVFERFYRADQARTSGGSGLGLAIVSALVTAHGGAVWVDSRPGEGATFSIALPLAPEVVGHEAEHDELDPPADEQFGHGAATSTDEAAGQPAGPADHQSDAAGGWPPPEGQDRRQLPKLDFTQPEVIELRRSQEPPG